MNARDWRRVRRAAILGAVLGTIGMAGRYTKESLPHHANPVQTYIELGTEAATPPALFVLLAWISTLFRSNKVQLPRTDNDIGRPVALTKPINELRVPADALRRPQPPARTASRIHRGFHRVGVVLAVPPLLLSAWLAGSEAWAQWTAPAHALTPTNARSVSIEDPLAPYLKPALTPSDPFADLIGAPVARQADYSGALIALALSIALYAAARAVGWVLDGFLSPGGRP